MVETDHQPLIPLFNNPNSRPLNWIEGWLLYLQQFDFKLTYIPGGKHSANYLSRYAIPLSKADCNSATRGESVMSILVRSVVPKALTLEEVVSEMENDKILQKLIQHIHTGDYRACKKDPDLQQYVQMYSELCYTNGLVTRGNRIVVPDKLRDRVTQLCHEGHLGIAKTKQLLRSNVWYPGIDRRVEVFISGCIACQAAIPKSQRDPLVELPSGPWTDASADLCEHFPTIFEKIFTTHGIPN